MGCSGSSLPPGDEFLGQVSWCKKEGYGEYRWSSGAVYRGYWHQDRMHGEGELHSPNGDVYKGPFRNGSKCGKGVLKGRGLERYEGDFDDDRFNGTGKYVYPNGDIYKGSFVHGLRQGQGEQDFRALEEHYSGEWLADKRHGQGTLVYRNDYLRRLQYEGQWANDMKCGRGVLTFAHEGYYKGEFKDDLYHGEGELLFENGDEFKGVFERGNMLRGRMKYLETDIVYDGEFLSDRPHGAGKMRKLDGSVYQGEFENGLRHGFAQLRLQNGDVYEGFFQRDAPAEGTASIEYGSSHARYSGNCRSMKPHGVGTITFANGNQYIGEWQDGMRHGKGKLLFLVDGDGHKLPAVETTDVRYERDVLVHVANPFRLAALRLAIHKLTEERANAQNALAELSRQSMQNVDVCSLCKSNKVNTMLLNCQHYLYCDACVTSLTACRKCKAPVAQVVRTYLP